MEVTTDDVASVISLTFASKSSELVCVAFITVNRSISKEIAIEFATARTLASVSAVEVAEKPAATEELSKAKESVRVVTELCKFETAVAAAAALAFAIASCRLKLGAVLAYDAKSVMTWAIRPV